MKREVAIVGLLIILSGIAILLLGCAPTVVMVRPPEPRVEVYGLPPYPEAVWIPGHWASPPRPHAVWIHGYWEPRRGGWVWIPGHWEYR